MSADKHPAEVLADKMDGPWEGVLLPTRLKAAAMLRRIPALEAERDQLRAEVESLRADAERLDFIAKRARYDPKMDGQHVWWPTTFNNALRGPTLRDAIDAARKQQ